MNKLTILILSFVYLIPSHVYSQWSKQEYAFCNEVKTVDVKNYESYFCSIYQVDLTPSGRLTKRVYVLLFNNKMNCYKKEHSYDSIQDYGIVLGETKQESIESLQYLISNFYTRTKLHYKDPWRNYWDISFELYGSYSNAQICIHGPQESFMNHCCHVNLDALKKLLKKFKKS